MLRRRDRDRLVVEEYRRLRRRIEIQIPAGAARRFALDHDDLHQEAGLALVRASRRYSEDRGSSFGAYCSARGLGAALDMVKRPRHKHEAIGAEPAAPPAPDEVELRDALDAAERALRGPQRRLLRAMRRGASMTEAALEAGFPPATAVYHARRALRAARDAIVLTRARRAVA